MPLNLPHSPLISFTLPLSFDVTRAIEKAALSIFLILLWLIIVPNLRQALIEKHLLGLTIVVCVAHSVSHRKP